MRITDAEDDYTVTADQRAALMELESLTWNYPTPQQARSRTSPSLLPQASHHHDDEDDDSDDDDDDDSYYADMVSYDMTERLKEVNRALIEDPTPAECDRAITVRFREVIADYQSPRDCYPSDSDDGYGDSSDLLYDAEEEDGLTSLTSEVKEILGGNVNVVDLMADLTQENGSLNHNTLMENLTNIDQEDTSGDIKSLIVTNESKVKWNDNRQEESKADVPRLQLGGHLDESQVKPAVNYLVEEDRTRSCSQVPCEKRLLKVDESGLADLETFIKENDTSDILERLSGDSLNPPEEEVKEGTMSLIEVSEGEHIDKGHSSLGDVVNEELIINERSLEADTQTNTFFQRRESNDNLEPTNLQLPAKSDADFASFEYSDDFEDFQDESERPETESKEEESPASPVAPLASPVQSKADPPEPSEVSCKTPERTHGSKSAHSSEVSGSQKQGHRSRKDQSPRKSTAASVERSKKRTDSKSPPDVSKSSALPRTKSKHVAAAPPMIKPALLSSDKLNSMKTSDSSRHRTRATTASRSGSRSVISNSSSSSSSSASSPLSSASSSSSYSSCLSTYSSTNIRGRSRTPISGPVRPTAHRSAGGPHGGSPRVPSSSPVRLPTTAAQNGLALAPTNPALVGRVGPVASGRAPPHAKVRKAASASDLHKVTEDSEDRKKQNDEVFKAWLRQKNRQATVTKKHHHAPVGGKNSPEVTERRKRAEDAFQAWLSRKREQLRLEKKLRGERRRLEDQSRYARSKTECELAYKEWCRRKREEVRTTTRSGAGVPRSQSLERPWAQEKTRKLYSAYLNGH
ncbi:coiled-coil domain-containing protein 181-like isoform X2 [Homarus americanus]|uniref:coiled-coil domain-containing protein 181-like isoform X2 n=1 Tax=Homarus americanus TaxID=6706 RepID=UPI001C461D6F|nr:coiled-coil domain-containing protein 181-like isoform X2 [Homarus americanus]XP_042224944.1 coiled-coil domain-containing protein 181-like isoform X2 [Homarus americanus]